MINVKQAVDAAVGYVEEFANLVPLEGIRLEETDFDDRENQWQITLSFIENEFTGHRIAKLFRIDASTGSVLSMKARSVFART